MQLKSSGYKIVQVKAKEPVQTIAEYDQQLEKDLAGGTSNFFPTVECGTNDQRMRTGLGERMKTDRILHRQYFVDVERNAYRFDSFVTTPRGLHGQGRTADHPQNGRAQHSRRARARANIQPPNQSVGVESRGSLRATSSRSPSRTGAGC